MHSSQCNGNSTTWQTPKFCSKMGNFWYSGNMGWSYTDVVDTVKFDHPENFHSGAQIIDIS